MTDDHAPEDPAGTGRDKDKTPNIIPEPLTAGTEGGDVGNGEKEKPDSIANSGIIPVVPGRLNPAWSALRRPEWIMAFFTIVIACSAIAQCHEMQTGGADTAKIAQATKDFAAAMKAQAASTAQLVGANQTSASAAGVSAKAAQAQAGSARREANLASDALIESNRAWLQVKPLFWDQPHVGKLIRVTVPAQNIGREPASSITSSLVPFISKPASYMRNGRRNIDFDTLNIPNNDTCKALSPARIGVIWPAQALSVNDDHSVRANLPFFRAERVLGYRGCVSYVTFGRRHYTRFCFYWPPPGGNAVKAWSYCAGDRQNSAD